MPQPNNGRWPPAWLSRLWAASLVLAVVIVLLWQGPWALLILGTWVVGTLLVVGLALLVLWRRHR